MPCYTQRTITTELKAANHALLMQALQEQGFNPVRQSDGSIYIVRQGLRGSIRDGQITVPATHQYWVNEIKRSYADTAVKAAARRFNWQVQQQKDQSINLTRRFQ